MIMVGCAIIISHGPLLNHGKSVNNLFVNEGSVEISVGEVEHLL